MELDPSGCVHSPAKNGIVRPIGQLHSEISKYAGQLDVPSFPFLSEPKYGVRSGSGWSHRFPRYGVVNGRRRLFERNITAQASSKSEAVPGLRNASAYSRVGSRGIESVCTGIRVHEVGERL